MAVKADSNQNDFFHTKHNFSAILCQCTDSKYNTDDRKTAIVWHQQISVWCSPRTVC